jgi:hypothetical protein
MDPDLVPGLNNSCHLFWERLDRVAWNEPACLNSEALEQLQKPWAANFTSEHAPRNVIRRILASI